MSNQTNSFKRVIGAANSGKRFPIMSVVRDDPQMAAVIAKMVSPRETPNFGQDGNRETAMPNVGHFKTISDQTSQNINDAQTTFEVLPDIQLAAQILVSSTLAPKDMNTTELTYSHGEGLMAPDVSAALIAFVRQHFEEDYKIKPLLYKMLMDALFLKGSYPIAVIPENSIDEIINGQGRITLESLSSEINTDGSVKPMGLLGPAYAKSVPTAERTAPGLSLEGLNTYSVDTAIDQRVTFQGILDKPVSDSYLSVTDNLSLLKIPMINQKIRESRIKNQVGSRAMEALSGNSKLNDRELTGLIYKNRQYAYMPIASLKTQEQLNRNTVGNPMVLHLPSESVIPVYVPGSMEQHVGYFLLVDSDGNPVTKSLNPDHYSELGSRLNGSGSFSSAMMSKVRNQMSGFDPANRDHLNYSAKAYGDMVEQDLLARLRNGVYGNGVAIAKQEEVYRIMFARALAKKHTQLLFIPVELMTYIALDFNENGVGKSLLDNMKIINSMRSMLTFANTMASLRNSVGRTEVKLKFDDSDPNPKKTLETAMAEILRTRQAAFPLGMNAPADMVDWLGRAGINFTYDGHPGMPDVNIEFSEKNSNYPKPDTDLEDSLRKRSIMSLGVPPTAVDATFESEFATSIVTSNVLMAKQVIQIQDKYTPLISQFMRKYMMNSENMINGLRTILENNFDKLRAEPADSEVAKKAIEQFKKDGKDEKVKAARTAVVLARLNNFLATFEVSLPKPNSVTLENQLNALETYTKALDATIDAWISDKFFTDSTGGEVAAQVETVKEVVKAYFVRKWLAENGVMTELGALTTEDGDGKPTLDLFAIQKNHIDSLSASMTDFFKDLKPIKDRSDQAMAKLGDVGESASATSETPVAEGGDEAISGGSDDLEDAPIPLDGDDGVEDLEDDGTSGTDDAPKEDKPAADDKSDSADKTDPDTSAA